MPNHKLFKVNQDAVIKNNNGEFLILKQNDVWKLPGGRLEDDETAKEGLLRGIKEETAIIDCKIDKIINIVLSGSKSTYLVTFLCSTEEIEVILSDEHTEYAWVDVKDLDRYNFQHNELKDLIKIT